MVTKKTLRLQTWLAVQAATGNAGRIQELSEQVDTSDASVGVAQIEYPDVSNCTLMLQSCDTLGGEFVTNAAFTQGATAACVVYLNRAAPVGASDRLSRYLRWKILGDEATNWKTTFQMTLVLK
jgi:hypothetical protein